ncbi:MAG: toxin-antitoxin system HicB family antitoxin [Rhodanobacteraceae bacterium]|nr:MAG: toxin-antitoxin system HicB family antitoxin [Rhodanobacteraceae bacterium]
MNARHYTYRVIWSEEDKEYVGLCAEFPGLSWLAGTMEGALKGIARVVTSVVKDMEKSGEVVPEPISARRYSGKFQVRTTPERHRLLALQAAEAGVSINRLVNDRLAG